MPPLSNQYLANPHYQLFSALALLCPASGVNKGLSAIYQCAVLADAPMETAARAKALCMVVRTPGWKPRTGDHVKVIDYSSQPQSEQDVTQKPNPVYQTAKGKRLVNGDE